MNTKVKIVVVGYGGMGKWHTTDRINKVEGIELAGIYDIDPAKIELAKSKGIYTYDSLEAVLADESVNLVTIATPNDCHKDIAIACLEAGKNVVSEKPVTLCSADLEEMIAAANKAGKLFTVHQNRRWDEDFRVAKAMYQSKQLGRVYSIESRVQGSRGIPGDWRNTKAQGGGMVLDWGVHLLDQMLQMTGRMPISVYAQLSNVTNEEVDDGFKALFSFGEDFNFHIEVGTSNFIVLPRWYVQGLNGTTVIDDFAVNGKTVVATADITHDAVPIVTAAGLTKTMAPREPDTIKEVPLERIDCNVDEFYQNVVAVINGEAEPIVTHQQQRDLMKVMEAIFDSAEKNEVIYF